MKVLALLFLVCASGCAEEWTIRRSILAQVDPLSAAQRHAVAVPVVRHDGEPAWVRASTLDRVRVTHRGSDVVRYRARASVPLVVLGALLVAGGVVAVGFAHPVFQNEREEERIRQANCSAAAKAEGRWDFCFSIFPAGAGGVLLGGLGAGLTIAGATLIGIGATDGPATIAPGRKGMTHLQWAAPAAVE
jgi:hypothetical protein